MALLSFFWNILATKVFLNLLLRRVHLSLSQIISLMHCSHFFLSDMEEVVWGEESSVSVLFGLIVVFCFFDDGSNGVRVGDVKWNVFRFLGGNDCLVAATLASSASGDDDVEGGCGSGLISRGMGSEWESFIIDVGPEDRVFIINWDHDCFVVDVNGVESFSWSPGGPVVGNVKVSLTNEGTKEVELVVVGMHADEDDSIVSAQGEDGGGGESCTGEFMVD